MSKRQIILLVLMVLGALGGYLMKPQVKETASLDKDLLERNIPHQFGDWVDEGTPPALVVSADVQKELQDIYSQVLSRTYKNKKTGYRIMLSLAYGGEQSRSLQVHRPEVCYAAQGFHITVKEKAELIADKLPIPVMHLLAVNHDEKRYEPITYWIRIGDVMVRGNLEQGFARLKYGLLREVPDGLLFRVSSIDENYQNALAVQSTFIHALVASLSADGQRLMLGNNRTPKI